MALRHAQTKTVDVSIPNCSSGETIKGLVFISVVEGGQEPSWELSPAEIKHYCEAGERNIIVKPSDKPAGTTAEGCQGCRYFLPSNGERQRS